MMAGENYDEMRDLSLRCHLPRPDKSTILAGRHGTPLIHGNGQSIYIQSILF